MDVKLFLTADEVKALLISLDEMIDCLIDYISIASHGELTEIYYSLFVLSKLYNAIDV